MPQVIHMQRIANSGHLQGRRERIADCATQPCEAEAELKARFDHTRRDCRALQTETWKAESDPEILHGNHLLDALANGVGAGEIKGRALDRQDLTGWDKIDSDWGVMV
eukprot:1140858-Pelagomonas_calceolata.AAC.5